MRMNILVVVNVNKWIEWDIFLSETQMNALWPELAPSLSLLGKL